MVSRRYKVCRLHIRTACTIRIRDLPALIYDPLEDVRLPSSGIAQTHSTQKAYTADTPIAPRAELPLVAPRPLTNELLQRAMISD